MPDATIARQLSTSSRLKALKEEIAELRKLVTEVAVQSKRLDILEERYEELRHGEGYVVALKRSGPIK